MAGERILVVDDEPQILRFLKPSLGAAGFTVFTASTGDEALRLAATAAPDVILLDLGLPDSDGKDVLKALRQWSAVPVIVLSARDQESEKIAALDLGADDYVNKPFAVGELMARLRSVIRRQGRNAIDDATLAAGPLAIDAADHSATLSGVALKLTPKEFDLLALLTRNAGRVMTHRQILTAVWGPAHTEDLQYLRVLIGQIRQKLDDAGGMGHLIKTEPAIGYRLLAEI